ncbi:hypothetical protein ACFXKC_42270 [Streptomyces sp. NPDC059340]
MDSSSALELLLTLEDAVGLEIGPKDLEAEILTLSNYVEANLARAAGR